MSHVDPNKVRRAYNHAEYVEPRRKMIQEWADPLDEWEENYTKGIEGSITLQSTLHS